MRAFSTVVVALAALVASVAAQSTPVGTPAATPSATPNPTVPAPPATGTSSCSPVYDTCKNDVERFKETTCDSLKTKANGTVLFTQCLCYYSANLVNCYAQCAGNSIVDAELNGKVIPERTANCAAANLNHLSLPQPPPWNGVAPTATVPTVVATPTGGPSVATPTATGTTQNPSTQQNSSGERIASWAVGSAAVVAGAVGLML
ncbi:hypothetical protein DFS34DRAFT_689863 [Phlyctochytrium arcticum]|nr:hypothetical protein DFS34DRAFT_689863 [Phlyctochytrium arcticum]